MNEFEFKFDPINKYLSTATIGYGKHDEHGNQSGYWVYYYATFDYKKKIAYEGNFINNKPTGVWKVYNENGDLITNEYYI